MAATRPGRAFARPPAFLAATLPAVSRRVKAVSPAAQVGVLPPIDKRNQIRDYPTWVYNRLPTESDAIGGDNR
jgi:hypothetical protein